MLCCEKSCRLACSTMSISTLWHCQVIWSQQYLVSWAFPPPGMCYWVTEYHTLPPVPGQPITGASFSVCLTTPATAAIGAFSLFLLRLCGDMSPPTPAASGNEPQSRSGDLPRLVRSLYHSHQENAPAASPDEQEPGPALCKSAQGLRRKRRRVLREGDKT